MTAFILERKTPKQFRLEAASAVRGNDKGYSFMPLMKTDPEAGKVAQVMGALMDMARRLPPHKLELSKCYEAARNDRFLAKLMEGTSFSPRQSNGRPPMVTVRG